jgi:Cu/Ag efflux pump CusA
VLGDRPGQEIEYPLAVVILGGLITSTALNLFVVPSLYLRFGQRRRERPVPAVPDPDPHPQPVQTPVPA